MKRTLLLIPLMAALWGCQREPPPSRERPAGSAAVSGVPSPKPPAAALTRTPAPAGPEAAAVLPEPLATAAPAGGKSPAFEISPPVVRLVNPGREPRRELAYRYAPEPSETGLELRATADLAFGAAPVPRVRLPALALTAKVTPKSVSPSGDLSFAFRVGDIRMLPTPDANAQVVALLGEALKDPSAGWFAGNAVISRKGLVRELRIEAAAADPRLSPVGIQVRNRIGGFMLPEGPVGPGAVWETVQTLTTQGGRVRQVTRFTLESRQGGRFRVKTVFLQTLVEPGPAGPPAAGLPAFRVNAMDVSLSGVLEWDVSSPLPVSGSAAGAGTLRADLGQGGQKQPVSLSFDLDLRLKPPKKP